MSTYFLLPPALFPVQRGEGTGTSTAPLGLLDTGEEISPLPSSPYAASKPQGSPEGLVAISSPIPTGMAVKAATGTAHSCQPLTFWNTPAVLQVLEEPGLWDTRTQETEKLERQPSADGE